MINKQASLLKMRANRDVIIEQAGVAAYAKKSPREIVAVPRMVSRCQFRALLLLLPPITQNIYHITDSIL